jgi:hypothetical protein
MRLLMRWLSIWSIGLDEDDGRLSVGLQLCNENRFAIEGQAGLESAHGLRLDQHDDVIAFAAILPANAHASDSRSEAFFIGPGIIHRGRDRRFMEAESNGPERKSLDQRAQMTELERLRHSCAHVMATAILRLWPDAQFAYGPPVENGFYYDVELDHRISPEDFRRSRPR